MSLLDLVFGKPIATSQERAEHTLTIIIVLLMLFLGGIALLCRSYNIAATDPTGPGYQSVLSMLIAAVFGRGWFYYVAIASILSVLALSANSQAGMVVHWKPSTAPARARRMVVNGIEAIATGITLLVVLVAKFRDGAWITAILVPLLILLMAAVKRHYTGVARTIAVDTPIRLDHFDEPLVVVPLDHWTRITEKGFRFAMKISTHVEAVHVDAEDCSALVCASFRRNVVDPAAAAGRTPPEFILLPSQYRFVLMPLVDHILTLERTHPERQIAVLIPELVVRRWWRDPSTTSAPSSSSSFSSCTVISASSSSTSPGTSSCRASCARLPFRPATSYPCPHAPISQ